MRTRPSRGLHPTCARTRVHARALHQRGAAVLRSAYGRATRRPPAATHPDGLTSLSWTKPGFWRAVAKKCRRVAKKWRKVLAVSEKMPTFAAEV